MRAQRIDEGSVPVAAQLDRLLSVVDQPDAAYVTSTFQTPLPWHVFVGMRGDDTSLLGRIADEATVTVYFESSSGYPVQYTGPAAIDLQAAVVSFVQQQADSGPEPTSESSNGLSSDLAGVEAEDVRSRLVVLGIATSYSVFVSVEPELREFGIVAAEVEPGPGGQAFTVTSEPFTDEAVRSWREFYSDADRWE